MKKFLSSALIALLLVAPMLGADSYPVGRVLATLMRNFDVTATSLSYNVFGDVNSALNTVNNDGVTGALGEGTKINKKVKTVGSSTTVASVVGTDEPYRGRAVGDLLLFNSYSKAATTLGVPVEYERQIATFSSSNSVVVDSAIDLSEGVTFSIKKLLGGAAADDAWFNVQGFDAITVQFIVTTINATSLDSTLECRVSKFAGTPQTVQTDNWTAVGSKVAKLSRSDADYEQCRVGWKVNTDAGAQSVSVYFLGVK